MFDEANAELEEIDPLCRSVREVLVARVIIYHGLKRWELMAVVAGRLVEWNPGRRRHHALQRTAPGVTAPAPRRPAAQEPRRPPQSLSVRSLGGATP